MVNCKSIILLLVFKSYGLADYLPNLTIMYDYYSQKNLQFYKQALKVTQQHNYTFHIFAGWLAR